MHKNINSLMINIREALLINDQFILPQHLDINFNKKYITSLYNTFSRRQ